ncbi:MAG: indole-3-glycerol-phosphate synthase TrpC, partial [Actinobacteria bacterium]
LATLAVDGAVVAKLRPLIPDGAIVVGESGVSTRADVDALRAATVDAVLVGEAVMRAADPARTIAELLSQD